MKTKFHLDAQERPTWLQYPQAFDKVASEQDGNLEVWYFIEADRIRAKRAGLSERYPSRDLFPFAVRDDNDDVACWENKNPSAVVVIHDFASAGHEQKGIFPTFDTWLEQVSLDNLDY